MWGIKMRPCLSGNVFKWRQVYEQSWFEEEIVVWSTLSSHRKEGHGRRLFVALVLRERRQLTYYSLSLLRHFPHLVSSHFFPEWTAFSKYADYKYLWMWRCKKQIYELSSVAAANFIWPPQSQSFWYGSWINNCTLTGNTVTLMGTSGFIVLNMI